MRASKLGTAAAAIVLAIALAACSPTFVRNDSSDPDDSQPVVATLAVLAFLLSLVALIAALVARRRNK